EPSGRLERDDRRFAVVARAAEQAAGVALPEQLAGERRKGEELSAADADHHGARERRAAVERVGEAPRGAAFKPDADELVLGGDAHGDGGGRRDQRALELPLERGRGGAVVVGPRWIKGLPARLPAAAAGGHEREREERGPHLPPSRPARPATYLLE